MLNPPPPFFKSLTRSAIQFVIVLVEILTIHLLYYYLFHLKKNKEKNSINHKRTNVINNFSSRVSDLLPVAADIWHISLVYNMKLSNQSLTWIKESELKLLILKWFMYEKIIFAFGRRMKNILKLFCLGFENCLIWSPLKHYEKILKERIYSDYTVIIYTYFNHFLKYCMQAKKSD